MVCRFLSLTIAFAACAAPVAAPARKPVQQAAVAPATMEARCAEAAKLRNDGYVALNALKLEAARKAYLRSLELDPDNRGAMFQLDVIESLGSDRQVGSSAANDALYNGANMSPCQKFEAQKMAAKKPKPVGPPQVLQSGQIISFAKGNAHDRDLLSHSDLKTAASAVVGNVLSCYRQGLSDNPGLHGDVTANLIVEADGHVSEVLLEGNSVDDAVVERCVEVAFSGLHFPRRKGSNVALHVLVPLTLQTAEIDSDLKAARR